MQRIFHEEVIYSQSRERDTGEEGKSGAEEQPTCNLSVNYMFVKYSDFSRVGFI